MTDHIARSSLISMDVQVAIVTVQHMPWSTDDGSTVDLFAHLLLPAHYGNPCG